MSETMIKGWLAKPGTRVIVNDALVEPGIPVAYMHVDSEYIALRLVLPVIGEVWARVTEYGAEQEDDGTITAYYFNTDPVWFEARANNMPKAVAV